MSISLHTGRAFVLTESNIFGKKNDTRTRAQSEHAQIKLGNHSFTAEGQRQHVGPGCREPRGTHNGRPWSAVCPILPPTEVPAVIPVPCDSTGSSGMISIRRLACAAPVWRSQPLAVHAVASCVVRAGTPPISIQNRFWRGFCTGGSGGFIYLCAETRTSTGV